jgi:hypothetical protein
VFFLGGFDMTAFIQDAESTAIDSNRF